MSQRKIGNIHNRRKASHSQHQLKNKHTKTVQRSKQTENILEYKTFSTKTKSHKHKYHINAVNNTKQNTLH